MDTLTALEESVVVTVAVPPEAAPEEPEPAPAATSRVSSLLRVLSSVWNTHRFTHLDRKIGRTQLSWPYRLDCRWQRCSPGSQSRSFGCCRDTSHRWRSSPVHRLSPACWRCIVAAKHVSTRTHSRRAHGCAVSGVGVNLHRTVGAGSSPARRLRPRRLRQQQRGPSF